MLIRGVLASRQGREKSTMPVPAPTLRSGAGYIPPPLPGREITLRSSPAKSGSARTQGLAISGGLEFEELRVASLRSQQFIVRAQFRNPPVSDHRDAVGDAHGREPVRDHDANA